MAGQIRHNGWCLQAPVEVWINTQQTRFNSATFLAELASATRLEVISSDSDSSEVGQRVVSQPSINLHMCGAHAGSFQCLTPLEVKELIFRPEILGEMVEAVGYSYSLTRDGASVTDAPPTTTRPPATGPGFLQIVLAVAGILLIVVVAVVIIFRGRKRRHRRRPDKDDEWNARDELEYDDHLFAYDAVNQDTYRGNAGFIISADGELDRAPSPVATGPPVVGEPPNIPVGIRRGRPLPVTPQDRAARQELMQQQRLQFERHLHQLKLWWKDEEFVRGVGISKRNTPYPWVMGFISTTASEQILQTAPVGAFHVRLSPRKCG